MSQLESPPKRRSVIDRILLVIVVAIVIVLAVTAACMIGEVLWLYWADVIRGWQ